VVYGRFRDGYCVAVSISVLNKQGIIIRSGNKSVLWEGKNCENNVESDNINKNIIYDYYSTATTPTTLRISYGTLK
jgi:hypothetical protein